MHISLHHRKVVLQFILQLMTKLNKALLEMLIGLECCGFGLGFYVPFFQELLQAFPFLLLYPQILKIPILPSLYY